MKHHSVKVKGTELSLVQNEVVSGVTSTKADFAARRLYVIDQIEMEQALQFLVNLGQLDRSRGPIEVVVMSMGGHEPAGWAIYDAMREARNEISTLGVGVVGSMAVPILLAGDRRRMSAECHVMLHAGSVSMEDSVDQGVFLSRARGLEKTNLRYNEVLADRTKLTLQQVTEACNGGETLYMAQEALAAGFVHEVVPYSKKGKQDDDEAESPGTGGGRHRSPRAGVRRR